MGSLFALLLLIAQQASPPQDDGPVATVSRAGVTPQQAATPLPGEAEYTPTGAPEDDYAFVGWCHGVLSGHRELAQKLGGKLTADDQDKAMEADLERIGAEYLDLYQSALLSAEMSRPRSATERALLARDQGYAKWTDALHAAEHGGKDAAGREIDVVGSYIAWSLPGRCEHASKRLLGGPELSDAYKLKPLDGATTVASAEPAPTSAVAVAPAPTPEQAKADKKSLWSRVKRFGRD